MRRIVGTIALVVLAGCETTGGAGAPVGAQVQPVPGDEVLQGEALRARLAGQTVEMRPVGGPDPDEPEAFILRLYADGRMEAEPVGVQTATVRDGPVAIRIPLSLDGRWAVRGNMLCIGREADDLDCQPATISGGVLSVYDRETGETSRGPLQPIG